MEREPRRRLPKRSRYPIYMVGLLVLIVGELGAYSVKAGVIVEAAVAIVGFILLVLSVALR